jgi:hypothetical protein
MTQLLDIPPRYSERMPPMYYKAVKENDGTYTIRESKAGLNYSVIMAGVRGCNVNRIINRLYSEAYYRE